MTFDPNDEEQMLAFLRAVPDESFHAVDSPDPKILELRAAVVIPDGWSGPLIVIEKDRDINSRFALEMSLAIRAVWPMLGPSETPVAEVNPERHRENHVRAAQAKARLN